MRALPQYVPMSDTDKTHTLIHDFLFRTTWPTTAAAVFKFFDQEGRQLGLDMNISKMELHTMHGASPVTVITKSKASLSTYFSNGTPHPHYKYLGVFFFTDPKPLLLYESLNNEKISPSTVYLTFTCPYLPKWPVPTSLGLTTCLR